MTVKFQIKYTLKTLSEFGYFNVTADNLKQVRFKLDDGGFLRFFDVSMKKVVYFDPLAMN